MLHYVERGVGAPLVLLHGNGESHEIFDGNIETLSRHFRVIAVDTPGHGRSPRGTGPFTLRRFAEDLRAFFDELGIEKAHLLGFSDGGNIALLFALMYPHRVNKLILVGANFHPFGMTAKSLMEVAICYIRDAALSLFSEKARQSRKLQALMLFQPRIRRPELKRITAETLVIAGRQDMIRPGHTLRLKQGISRAELRIIEGSHFVLQENPEVFNRVVLEFLLKGRKGN